MARILYLGKSEIQRESLPPAARVIFEWAGEQLQADPFAPPNDPTRGCETKSLGGPDRVYRIAIRPKDNDPGYRAIYANMGNTTVAFLRIVRRDATTYPGLRRALRLVRDRDRDP